ncbi:MAG: hypothetical protein D8M18_05245, partial [Bacteroidetes bacterium]|nr:hypothetical protein [Bacteroidota bacterium]
NEVAGLQFAANFEEEPPTLADTVPTSCTTPTRFTFSALRAVRTETEHKKTFAKIKGLMAIP